MGEGEAPEKKHAWGETPLPTAARPPQSPASCPGRGPCLLREVEGVAVGLGMEPAAAERLTQDGVVRLLDPLQAMNKQPHGRRRVGLGRSGDNGPRDNAGLSGPCLRGVLTTSRLQGEHETPTRPCSIAGRQRRVRSKPPVASNPPALPASPISFCFSGAQPPRFSPNSSSSSPLQGDTFSVWRALQLGSEVARPPPFTPSPITSSCVCLSAFFPGDCVAP